MPADQKADSLVGHTSTGEPVWLRYQERTGHLAVVGLQGVGKTTLLEHLIVDDFRGGAAAVVIDAHGDLTERLVSLAPLEVRERIVLVDMDMKRPLGLNLYECPADDDAGADRVADDVVALFKKLFDDQHRGAYRPVIEAGVRNSAYVMIANGFTMTEIEPLFTDPRFREKALRAVRKDTVLSYWRRYENCRPDRQYELSEPVLTRVNAVLSTEAVRLMVGQSRTTVPFDDVLDNSGVLLLRLGGRRLGDEAVSFVGMLLLAVLSNRIALRAGRRIAERRRVHLYLDEYGRFATSTTDRMIAEFRKHEIGITVAHQNLHQTNGRLVQTAALVVFRVSGADGRELAYEFDTTPRRTKQVAKLRTVEDATYIHKEIWDSDENKARYEKLLRDARVIGEKQVPRSRWMFELDMATLSSFCEPYDDDSRIDYVRCKCGGHGLVAHELIEHLRDGVPLTDADRKAASQLLCPRPEYYASAFWAVRPQPPTRGFVKTFRDANGSDFECYYLRAEAVEHAWIIYALRQRCGDRWVHEFIGELKKRLARDYERFPFSMLLPKNMDEFTRRRSPLVGKDRRYGDWPLAPHWRDDMPLGLGFEYLCTWVQEMQGRVRAGERERANEVRALREEADAFKAEHFRVESTKRVLGHSPVMRSIDTGIRIYPGKIPRLEREQIYDMVEELDQTHADRAAELATMLTQQGKFIAYCKLPNAGGQLREYSVRTLPPLQAEVEHEMSVAVSQQTCMAYGKKAALVDREIKQRLRLDDDGPPAAIGRRT